MKHEHQNESYEVVRRMMARNDEFKERVFQASYRCIKEHYPS